MVLPAGAALACLPGKLKGLADFGQALGETGGAGRDRTDDLYNAIVALSQLSYGPPSVMPSAEMPSRLDNWTILLILPNFYKILPNFYNVGLPKSFELGAEMDWQNVEKEMALQILRLGEVYVKATLDLATTIDQRASVLAGIFMTAAAAALAAVGSLLATPDESDIELVSGASALAVTWLLASGFCIAALWPKKYQLPGAHPNDWMEDNVVRGDIVEAIGGQCEIYQAIINHNEREVQRTGKWVKIGATLGCLASALGALAWWLSRNWA